eukprot:396523-Pyramimonas_sp.AAC.1
MTTTTTTTTTTTKITTTTTTTAASTATTATIQDGNTRTAATTVLPLLLCQSTTTTAIQPTEYSNGTAFQDQSATTVLRYYGNTRTPQQYWSTTTVLGYSYYSIAAHALHAVVE